MDRGSPHKVLKAGKPFLLRIARRCFHSPDKPIEMILYSCPLFLLIGTVARAQRKRTRIGSWPLLSIHCLRMPHKDGFIVRVPRIEHVAAPSAKDGIPIHMHAIHVCRLEMSSLSLDDRLGPGRDECHTVLRVKMHPMHMTADISSILKSGRNPSSKNHSSDHYCLRLPIQMNGCSRG